MEILCSLERARRLRLVDSCSTHVVALAGGSGTSDCVQKAELASKPVFPVAVAGGAAADEWKRLKAGGYFFKVPGDLDYLADHGASALAIAQQTAVHCSCIGKEGVTKPSNRVFVIHGHDSTLLLETARFLEKLHFEPVILHEKADSGKHLLTKLLDEAAGVGYAFVLLTSTPQLSS